MNLKARIQARSVDGKLFGDMVGLLVISIIFLFLLYLILYNVAHARDNGQYAGSPLKSWFDSLTSRNGPCCSDADGTVLKDIDWKSDNGHYKVRIQDQWLDVPESAVLSVPNLYGPTMVWPIYNDGNIAIRCFLPGSMT